MHEEALLRDLLRKIDEVARENEALRVTRVRLWVGALSHLAEAHLAERWAMSTVGSIAEGSQLDVTFSGDPGDPRANRAVLESIDTVGPAGEP